jgi:hypothetical protein
MSIWIPIALGVGKLLGDLFGGKSHEEDLRKRIERARERNAERRRQDIRDAYSTIGMQTSSLLNASRAAAGERAVALGRPQDVNAFILPEEAKIGEYASRVQQQALDAIRRQYDAYEANLDAAELGAPAGSNAWDYISELAGAGLNYWVGKQYLDALKEAQPQVPPPVQSDLSVQKFLDQLPQDLSAQPSSVLRKDYNSKQTGSIFQRGYDPFLSQLRRRKPLYQIPDWRTFNAR